MAKVDLVDGYYRVPLSPHAALHLAVCLPADHDTPPLVAIPLTPPMGWAQSPPFFCAFTETIADIANASLARHPHHPQLLKSQLPDQPQHASFHANARVLNRFSFY